jgi:hypothetical protein
MESSALTVDTVSEPNDEFAVRDTRRTEAESIRDLNIISRMYLRGAKPDEIASALVKQFGYRSLSGVQITLELAKLRRMWVQSALIDYDEAKAREIAHIDELEGTAWEAWKKSWDRTKVEVREAIEDHFGHGRPKKEISADEVDSGKVDAEGKKPSAYTRKRSTETSKEQFGDPRYLDTIKWCIEQRCKILGLHEPTRMAITWHEEAEKAGISPELAREIYNQMVTNTTKMVRDNILQNNEIPIPDELLDGEFNDEDDNIPDDFK